MLERSRERAAALQPLGPLGRHLATFADGLERDGYARNSLRIQLRLLAHLDAWLRRTRRTIAAREQGTVEAFIGAYRRRFRLKGGDRSTLRRFLAHLKQSGVVAEPASPAENRPLAQLERRYSGYLHQERGLTAATIGRYGWFVHRFLARRFAHGTVALRKLEASEVWRFVAKEAGSTGPKRAQLMASALRSFFRFLVREGETVIDLAASVPAVRCRGRSEVPKYLNDMEVEQLLRSCDRSTTGGRRDYAVLLLLARLGLRAGEVAGLRLEDIDWRSGEIRVLGKGRVRDRVLLLPEVGEALVAYLRHDRRSRPSREVFLRLKAPCRGFRTGAAVSTVVRRALSRASLDPPRKGAHLLRHSLATKLLRKGASMAEIAEVLRHRSPGTTEIYAKVDSASLRALAQPWPVSKDTSLAEFEDGFSSTSHCDVVLGSSSETYSGRSAPSCGSSKQRAPLTSRQRWRCAGPRCRPLSSPPRGPGAWERRVDLQFG